MAVDLGLRTGLAVWQRDGTLRTWRQLRYPSRRALRSGLPAVCRVLPPITLLVTEGDASLGGLWRLALGLAEADHWQVQAHDWRSGLFDEPAIRTTRRAKRSAWELAKTLASRHGARGAPHLRHDVAEAICLGFWAGMQRGW